MTITEWLIVLSVLAILVFLVAPNFLPRSSTRSPVSRARNDMRSIATAIETYFVDHGRYPTAVTMGSTSNSAKKIRDVRGGEVTMPYAGSAAVAGITTPVSYLTSLFVDPYAPERGLTFAYYTDGVGWIIYSPGPDKVYDINPTNDYNGRTTTPTEALLHNTYDPTNGPESAGDVWRLKQ